MASGQTALSLSDLPFMYSFVNLIFIWQTGHAGIVNLPVVGLIAGIIGTFLVFWHPIQWAIDRRMLLNKTKHSVYEIENNIGTVPPKYDLQLDDWFNLSLKTSAVKYLKDKISGQIYFIAILTTLLLLLFDHNFKQALNLENTTYPYSIQAGLVAMLVGLVIIYKKSSKEFILNVKITGAYFLISNNITRYGEPSPVIKEAIDLNDWDTAKNIVDKTLRSNWNMLQGFSTK